MVSFVMSRELHDRIQRERYFEVEPTSKDFAEVDDSFYLQFLERFPCRHRNPPKAIDICLRHRGEDVALTFAEGVVVSLARLDFLEALDDDYLKWLTLGRVFDRAGKLIPDLKTLGSRGKPLIVRGNAASTREFCPVCKSLQYFPLGTHYILRADLTGQPIYHKPAVGIIVNEGLCERLKRQRFKRIRYQELAILDKPRDGLPIDLSKVLPGPAAKGRASAH
jgi:hypothetical protein